MTESWPTLPYKGLSYYRPEDAALFAARDHDVDRIGRTLAAPDTGILILHGRTGCGKSSFLRAGLIPFLEQPEHGFRFLKKGTHESFSNAVNPLFVRSTENPLLQLSEEVFEFCSKPFTFPTPIGLGRIELDYVKARVSPKRDDFVTKCSTQRGTLVDVLGELADILPGTMTLVVDQAEEVLTLTRDPIRAGLKEQFFDFLADFDLIEMNLKILVTLRTEFFGEFINEIHDGRKEAQSVKQEVLKELRVDQIVVAIKHPTQYDKYRFRYDEGVPEEIARGLRSNNTTGGVLPFMQIVCGNLYERAIGRVVEGETAVISLEDYRELGDVSEQVALHVGEVLREMCEQDGFKGSIPGEVEKWYNILHQLVRVQVDGTVTTEQKLAMDLRSEAKRLSCEVDIESAFAFLAHDTRRIIQPVDVYNVQTETIHECYSLGHDAIGIAVRDWKIRNEAEKRLRELLKWMSRKERISKWLVVGTTVFGLVIAGAVALGVRSLVGVSPVGEGLAEILLVVVGVVAVQVLSMIVVLGNLRRDVGYLRGKWWREVVLKILRLLGRRKTRRRGPIDGL